mmetsp:Transcript_51715/g.110573  ORF Transcript_51715/g.110573 Transcript_51715/m.110573 type:complete len:257 (-) Transcript_51715:791-1561(-)
MSSGRTPQETARPTSEVVLHLKPQPPATGLSDKTCTTFLSELHLTTWRGRTRGRRACHSWSLLATHPKSTAAIGPAVPPRERAACLRGSSATVRRIVTPFVRRGGLFECAARRFFFTVSISACTRQTSRRVSVSAKLLLSRSTSLASATRAATCPGSSTCVGVAMAGGADSQHPRSSQAPAHISPIVVTAPMTKSPRATALAMVQVSPVIRSSDIHTRLPATQRSSARQLAASRCSRADTRLRKQSASIAIAMMPA